MKGIQTVVLIFSFLILSSPFSAADNGVPAYLNPDLPLSERVADLISRMTKDEKISQLVSDSPAIARLKIPKYNWWSEGLHGIVSSEISTVFPQAIGLAAAWNPELMSDIATAVSDEARALYHNSLGKKGKSANGITLFAPNINIFRDPRWGRGQETYGEDPYLTSRLAVPFIRGLQGDDPKYLKTVATPKHFAAHSGPEKLRHKFDATVSTRDLFDTYLPAFEAAVMGGGAQSIMTAYNRLNGSPASAHPLLLGQLLRGEWRFNGYVVSDCGAIGDIYWNHHWASSPSEAAARALRAGTDLSCGNDYKQLAWALFFGSISQSDLDRALGRILEARFRLGMFDPDERVPYSQIPISVVNGPKHRDLALRAARESIILLKNAGDLLPLKKTTFKRIAVIGPNAHAADVLLGNYHGRPSKTITPLEGIRAAVAPETTVVYEPGSTLTTSDRKLFEKAIAAAKSADIALLVLGLSTELENEEKDRTDLLLATAQEELLRAVSQTGTPTVLILINGGPLSVTWAAEHIPAIVEAWYPGEAGGTAIADVLFGNHNPSGRLPVTIYKTARVGLPPFDDYSMKGRTYRYSSEEPLYRFGHGLSYSKFTYAWLSIQPSVIQAGASVSASVRVRNIGTIAGDEVVQLYLSHVNPTLPAPIRSLQGFQKIHLEPGEFKTVRFTVDPRQMSMITEDGLRFVEPGSVTLSIGGTQPSGDSNTNVISSTFEIQGEALIDLP